MATVRPGVFEPGERVDNGIGQVTPLSIEIPANIMRTRVLERVVGEGVDLTQTPILVAGGRGIEDNFDILQELALLLGGDFGATRPPVDDGFKLDRYRKYRAIIKLLAYFQTPFEKATGTSKKSFLL